MTDTDYYQPNLAALKVSQPEVAALVDGANIPEGVTSATGRDGGNTYLIADHTGRRSWFGGSSMPTISAKELFGRLQADGGNLSLPGILTGLEPIVMLQQMHPHSALFVLEPDPLQLKLAMHLHDYRTHLDAGRLVLAGGDEQSLLDTLARFFERHPGYELPGRLMTPPQCSTSRLAELQTVLERGGRIIVDRQMSMIAERAANIRRRGLAPSPGPPRVAVLSTDPRPHALEYGYRIGRALGKLNVPHTLCLPDAPARCHTVARLQAVDEINASVALFVNGESVETRAQIPDELPSVSWLFPDAVVAQNNAESDGVCFAATMPLRDALLGSGMKPEFVKLAALAADDVRYRPMTANVAPRTDIDIAVLMDLPDDRSAACGIHLPSHVRLFEIVGRKARARARRLGVIDVEALLTESQRESGVTLRDAGVRAHFLEIVRWRIAPCATARATVEALTRHGFSVGAWGALWELDETLVGLSRGRLPAGDALNTLFNTVRAVVFPSSAPQAVQMALDAMAAGTPVLLGGAAESIEHQHPDLVGLIGRLHCYETSRELAVNVRRVLDAVESGTYTRDEVRSWVVEEHTTSRRLSEILATLRSREFSSVET